MSDQLRHVIRPARLKAGVTLDTLPAPKASDLAGHSKDELLVRGHALIFWDLKRPGKKKKLDAIDTDQITPAADCVSESLETLDERWKAGSFRYLMPDFRARVHRGETFVIAGDRFAIGSSREMSPAGLKGVAEEVGLEMVVVCGHNMGDIFRRNALNLGLQVVQSPEAVADARDGDAFSFDPATRRLDQRDAGQDLRAGAADAEGRRDPPDRRHLRDGAPRVRRLGRRRRRAIVWPDPATARRMTSTEQIVWAHRVDKAAVVTPGATLRVYADLLPASDGTAPFAIHTFNQITGGKHDLPAPGGDRQRSLRLHRQGRRRQADGDRPRVRGAARHREAVLRDAGRRHLPLLLSGAGARDAGAVHSRAPTRTAARTARTARSAWASDRRRSASAGRPATSTSRVAQARRVVFGGRLQPWVSGKDIVLEAAAALGREAVAGDVGRARRRQPAAADRLPQHDREHDGRGRGAQRHLRARRHHLRVVSREGDRRTCRTRRSRRARTRCTRSTRRSI